MINLISHITSFADNSDPLFPYSETGRIAEPSDVILAAFGSYRLTDAGPLDGPPPP